MNLAYTVRPLTDVARQRMTGTGSEISPFSASWSSTLTLLDRELRQLGASDVILMIDVNEGDLRIDGQMRANARPMSPKVALSFNARKRGSLLFCCGRFRNWQDNTRGLALGLEALRKLDRYGIIQSTEQYTGFRQLPTDSGAWVTVLAEHSGWSPEQVRADREGAYRAAVKNAHPDQGGTIADFAAVQGARR